MTCAQTAAQQMMLWPRGKPDQEKGSGLKYLENKRENIHDTAFSIVWHLLLFCAVGVVSMHPPLLAYSQLISAQVLAQELLL